jgi:hypothetical protein
MTAKKSKAKTLADFRETHDPNVIVPTKIRKALEQMAAEGPENWEYEADFVRRASVSQTQMGQFRDQFAAHVVETPHVQGRQPRKVWFASVKIAAKMREELI